MNLNYFTFALATAITLSSFLFNLLLLVRAEEDQSWGPKQRQIAVKDDSALVTINHVRFRDLRTGLMYGQYGTVHSTISTITGCAAACMDDGYGKNLPLCQGTGKSKSLEKVLYAFFQKRRKRHKNLQKKIKTLLSKNLALF